MIFFLIRLSLYLSVLKADQSDRIYAICVLSPVVRSGFAGFLAGKLVLIR